MLPVSFGLAFLQTTEISIAGAPLSIKLSWCLALSAVLFTIGVAGVLLQRNVIVLFMCVELMLNAVNLSLVAF